MGEQIMQVILDGGGPWGFRLQGGKDFGIPLNVSRVTPGSKAALKQMIAGDIICEINGVNTEGLSHMEAQNHIKNAGSRLTLKVKKGKGISVGDQNAISLGAAGSPKVLTDTNVVHSASVDHTFNPKPKPFSFGGSSSPAAQTVSPVKSAPAPSVQAPKFDPGAYARKKKEELEQRKKQESTVAGDSDILRMINATSISNQSPSPTPASGPEEGTDSGAFRMVYSGRDIHEQVSPESKSVISSLKDKVSQENSGLNSESKVPSRVFQMLQKQLDEEQQEDLPPPPPEFIEDDQEEPARPSFSSGGPGVQSRTFKMLQDSINSDQAHQSVFSRPQESRNKAVPMPSKAPVPPPPPTTVNPIPKAPMPKAPVVKAPTFNPSATSPHKPTGPQQSFKPSTSPQAFNAPQTTTARVTSQKQSLPVDPSRTPTCHSCSQEIRGPFVSAIGKTWHPDHFACNSCKVSLQNQGFVEEQNKLFCETCYNSFFAPTCAACGQSIIGVGMQKTRLCSHCLQVRSAGDDFKPGSVREVIRELKSEITLYEKQERDFREEREVVMKRLKVANWKRSELRREIFAKEEKKDRLDTKLKEAEEKLERFLEIAKQSRDLKESFNKNAKDLRERSSELESKIEHAKKWGQEMWRELSGKLAHRSQRHYHYQFVEAKSETVKAKVLNLEEQLNILHEKTRNFSRNKESDRAMSVKNSALIEQYEDDIMRCRERISFANQQYLTLRLYKESLEAEIESCREMRRDKSDQLASALRLRENKIINANYHVQYYR